MNESGFLTYACMAVVVAVVIFLCTKENGPVPAVSRVLSADSDKIYRAAADRRAVEMARHQEEQAAMAAIRSDSGETQAVALPPSPQPPSTTLDYVEYELVNIPSSFNLRHGEERSYRAPEGREIVGWMYAEDNRIIFILKPKGK